MRKPFLSIVCFVLISICISCHGLHGSDNICITVSENDEVYEMSSYFNKDKTRKVQRYITEQVGKENRVSFVNRKIDAVLMMNNHTTFHIKSEPGELEIKLDKDANSEEGYAQVKELCEGLKYVIEKE